MQAVVTIVGVIVCPIRLVDADITFAAGIGRISVPIGVANARDETGRGVEVTGLRSLIACVEA